jgi:hypothetical protein
VDLFENIGDVSVKLDLVGNTSLFLLGHHEEGIKDRLLSLLSRNFLIEKDAFVGGEILAMKEGV